MNVIRNILVETVASLIGIFIGAMAAFAADRYNERRRN